MSKRTSTAATNGAASKEGSEVNPPCMSRQSEEGEDQAPKTASLTPHTAIDKQKLLLSSDSGHFSLIRALHLADLITELNG
jgi:CDP-diacylglycerol--serine O-phosphatidyltransferase